MDLAAISSLVSTGAVIGGVAFAIIQIRDARRQQMVNNALEFMRSVRDPAFQQDLMILTPVPENRPGEDWESFDEEVREAGYRTAMLCESLGILVFRRVLPIDLVADMLALEPIWRRLRSFVDAERARYKDPMQYEWFQWLVERIVERESQGEGGLAYERHRNWRG